LEALFFREVDVFVSDDVISVERHFAGEVGQSTRRSMVRRWRSWSEPGRR